jgi:hypothetical protein
MCECMGRLMTIHKQPTNFRLPRTNFVSRLRKDSIRQKHRAGQFR